jgi:outer membrane receptor protein involved in Fe transport
LLAGATGAYAADEATTPPQGAHDAAPEQQPALLEEIVVTSSRAALPGFSASTPTTVIGSEVLEREDAANVAQVLNEIPGFKQTQSPAANGVKTGTPGTYTADLRGLGGQRTLVLVDGLRVPPTAPTTNTSVVDAVDLNTIPAFMVDRVEVVTGGASAQWGSDAVAGVVNIRLKDKFEGFQVKAQGGISQRSDDKNEYLAFLGGTSLFNDRGHFVAGVEAQNEGGVRDIYSRSFGRTEDQIIANAAGQQPAFLEVGNVHTSLGSGGTIVGPNNFPLKGYTFNPDGSVRPFQYGSLVSGVQMIGGEGKSTLTGFDMIPATRRVASYARTSFDITDSTTASLVLSYALNTVNFHGSLPRISAKAINAGNPFIPAAVAQQMAASKITSFTFSENAFDLGNTDSRVTNQIPRAVFALNGKIGDTWTWDTGIEWGMDRYHQIIENTTDGVRLNFALDAVNGPNGPACKATLAGNPAAAGCVPLNLFGYGAPSAAATAYVQQTGGSDSHYGQTDATANIKGTPLSTWAGPVAVAFGAEYRNESQNATASPQSAAGEFLISGNASPFTGSFNVKEGYIDTLVPLAKDAPFAKSLTFSGAARYEHYSDIGNQHTWKVGLDYQPVTAFRLRATHSIDIRAPQIFELYGAGTVLTNTATVRGQTKIIPQNVTKGNPNLTGENATTNTFGFVVQPKGGPLDGLSVSIDYYDIKIDNAITTLTAATIGNLCTAGNQAFCNFFTFDANGVPTRLDAGTLNAASEQQKGIDFNIAFQHALGSLASLPLSEQTSLLGTRTLHSFINTGTGGGAIDRAGENGPQNLGAIPHLTMNLTQGFTLGGASFSAQAQYVSRGTIDNTFNTLPSLTINNNSIASVVYLNLYSSYEINDHFQISASIRNALDKAPPLSPYPNLPVPQFNGEYYDVIGRAFRLAVTYRL